MRRNDDPVKTITRRETGKALILAAVFVLIICFAWMTYRWCTQRHEALPGEVILNGHMSFQRADEKLKDAWFKPMGLSRQYKDVTNQYYEGMDVCGYTTEYSYLSETKNPENRSLQIVHVFKDTEESNLDNPGEICKTVVEELTKIIGKEPEEGKDGYGTEKYLFWTLKASTEAVVLYMGDKNLMLTYVYNK